MSGTPPAINTHPAYVRDFVGFYKIFLKKGEELLKSYKQKPGHNLK